MKHYVMESIGTFFLVFTVCFTGQPLAIGLMFAAMIYLGSQGGYNPAITLALLIKGKLEALNAGLLMLAQCVGAFAAAAAFNVISNNLFIPSPLQHVSTQEAFIVEALFSFVLCAVALVMLNSNNPVSGLMIGLTLTAIIFAGSNVAGGIFNPAAATGTMLYDVLKNGNPLNNLVIYVPGPLVGGTLAALVNKYIQAH